MAVWTLGNGSKLNGLQLSERQERRCPHSPRAHAQFSARIAACAMETHPHVLTWHVLKRSTLRSLSGSRPHPTARHAQAMWKERLERAGKEKLEDADIQRTYKGYIAVGLAKGV